VIRRLFRIGLLLGLVGGVAFALTKRLANQTADAPAARTPKPWPRLESDPTVAAPPIARPIPDPAAPAAGAATKTATKAPPKVAKRWVEPTAGACPTSHPVKAKVSSKIFHLPGMTNYERTNPDRCYADSADAESDGLRAAKR
jgi:hypothetical protein